jgi:hypothetical protein
VPSNLMLLVASLSSGGFALLGVELSSRRTHWRDRTAFARETAFELVAIDGLLRSQDWLEHDAQLERIVTRLEFADVRADLVDAVAAVARACWHDHQTDGSRLSVRKDLLEARGALVGAVVAALVPGRKWTDPDRLAGDAIAQARIVLANIDGKEWPSAQLHRRRPSRRFAQGNVRCSTQLGVCEQS